MKAPYRRWLLYLAYDAIFTAAFYLIDRLNNGPFTLVEMMFIGLITGIVFIDLSEMRKQSDDGQ